MTERRKEIYSYVAKQRDWFSILILAGLYLILFWGISFTVFSIISLGIDDPYNDMTEESKLHTKWSIMSVIIVIFGWVSHGVYRHLEEYPHKQVVKHDWHYVDVVKKTAKKKVKR